MTAGACPPGGGGVEGGRDDRALCKGSREAACANEGQGSGGAHVVWMSSGRLAASYLCGQQLLVLGQG